MTLAYGVISIAALVMIGVCIAVDRKKDICLLLLFVSVFICDCGYFMLSISETLELALLANRVSYLGNVFLPFFMLIIILNLCGIRYRRWLPVTLILVGAAIFLIAASQGYATVYYKTVSIEVVDGVTRLVREYGPLHDLYYIYLFLYFAGMLAVVAYSLAKKKISSPARSAVILSVVLINILVWLAEQFLPRGFEYLSVSHVLSVALILFLYGVSQERNMRQRIICVWTVGFVCVGIALLCKFGPPADQDYYFLNLLRSFIYMGMYYAWGRIVCRGVIQKTLRRCFGGISALLIFWVAVSACRHFIFSGSADVFRWLWYSYYVVQILIAVLCLIAASLVGKGEDARPEKWIWGLFGAGTALILLVMTNDLHQLVFAFPQGMLQANDVYTCGAGYYIIMLLLAVCGISAMALVVFKCRVPGRKKFAGFPIIILLLLAAYCVLYFVEGSFVNLYLDDITTVSCLLVAILLEILIESGLIQTNIGYEYLFRETILAAQITDQDHQVRYASERAGFVSREIMEAADEAPVMLEGAVRLSGAEIRGGHIYWQEDMAEILSVQEELEMTQAELRDTGDVLKAESEQKARQLHLEFANRLYDIVEAQTAPQVSVLRELITQLQQTADLDTAKRLLGKIVVIGTYIKRRSNLIFVAGQEKRVRTEELLLCMQESAENLKLYGVDCGITLSGCEKLLPQTAYMVYDLFEAVIEKGMDTASSILVYGVPDDDDLFLAICADCSDDLNELCSSFPDITVWRDEDELWYLNLSTKKIQGGGGT